MGLDHRKNAKSPSWYRKKIVQVREEKQMTKIKKLCPVKGTLRIHYVAASAKGKVRTMDTFSICAKYLKDKLHRV